MLNATPRPCHSSTGTRQVPRCSHDLYHSTAVFALDVRSGTSRLRRGAESEWRRMMSTAGTRSASRPAAPWVHPRTEGLRAGWMRRPSAPRARCKSPPPPPRTNRTRRVPHPVLIGHDAPRSAQAVSKGGAFGNGIALISVTVCARPEKPAAVSGEALPPPPPPAPLSY